MRNYIKNLRDTTEVDGETLANWLGLSARAVRALAHDSNVARTPELRNRYLLKESIRKYCELTRRRAGIAAKDDDMESRLNNIADGAKLKKAMRELAEIKRDAIAKKLISIE